MKHIWKLLLFVVITLIAIPASAQYLGPVAETDSLPIPIILVDSLGKELALAADDSVFISVQSPNGVFLYRDSVLGNSAEIDDVDWEDGTVSDYSWPFLVGTLDGSKTDYGLLLAHVKVYDISLELSTARKYTFLKIRYPFYSMLDSSAYAQKNRAVLDTAIYCGAVYVDAGSNTNTVVGVDGTLSNPVSTIATAKTIADAIGAKTIYFLEGTNETLVAQMEHYYFIGIGSIADVQIDLGGQDVDYSVFENMVITGEQGGTELMGATNCALASVDSLEIHARFCAIVNNMSVRGGDSYFDNCYSAVAGNGTPDLDFDVDAATIGVSVRHYSGGLQLLGMTSNHTVSYESDGQLVINADCVSGNVTARGNMTITDNGTTTNLTEDAVFARSILSSVEDMADGVTDELLSGHTVSGSLGEQKSTQTEIHYL